MEKIFYEKGERILSLDKLMEEDLIFWRNKIYHKGWFQNWQLGWIDYQLKRGWIYKVEKVEEVEDEYKI